MKLEAIQTFLIVARLGSLSRAAEYLNVTQSTVSGRLDALDQALNRQLLDRAKKGTRLTPAGEDFRKHAEQIVRNWSAARAKSRLPGDFLRTFSLGCETDHWAGLGEGILRRARTESEETAFLVNTADRDGLLTSLENDLLDAVLVSTAPKLQGYRSWPIASDQLIQVSTRARATIAWDQTYVRVNYDEAFDTQHLHHWPENRTANVTFDNPEWALRHILEFGGSAYLPLRLTEQHLHAGRLYRVEGSPEFVREVFAIWHPLSENRHPWLKGLAMAVDRAV